MRHRPVPVLWTSCQSRFETGPSALGDNTVDFYGSAKYVTVFMNQSTKAVA